MSKIHYKNLSDEYHALVHRLEELGFKIVFVYDYVRPTHDKLSVTLTTPFGLATIGCYTIYNPSEVEGSLSEFLIEQIEMQVDRIVDRLYEYAVELKSDWRKMRV